MYEGFRYETQILDEMLCAKDRSCFDRMPVIWNTLLPTHLVRQTLEEMDGRMGRGEDGLCVYTCLFQVRSLACVEKPLYHYQIHGNSIMGRVGFGNFLDTALFYRQLVRWVEDLRPALLPRANSLFLYLISLGAYENPTLLGYSEVRMALWRERLAGCCRAWRQRVIRMRLKSLLAPRPNFQDKQGDIR